MMRTTTTNGSMDKRKLYVQQTLLGGPVEKNGQLADVKPVVRSKKRRKLSQRTLYGGSVKRYKWIVNLIFHGDVGKLIMTFVTVNVVAKLAAVNHRFRDKMYELSRFPQSMNLTCPRALLFAKSFSCVNVKHVSVSYNNIRWPDLSTAIPGLLTVKIEDHIRVSSTYGACFAELREFEQGYIPNITLLVSLLESCPALIRPRFPIYPWHLNILANTGHSEQISTLRVCGARNSHEFANTRAIFPRVELLLLENGVFTEVSRVVPNVISLAFRDARWTIQHDDECLNNTTLLVLLSDDYDATDNIVRDMIKALPALQRLASATPSLAAGLTIEFEFMVV